MRKHRIGQLAALSITAIVLTVGISAQAMDTYKVLVPEVTIVLPSAELLKFAEARPMPEMPLIAKAARVRATVAFRVKVSPQGTVSDVVEVRSHPMLSRAVADTLLRWRFRPIQTHGAPTTVWSVVTFRMDPNVVTLEAEDPAPIAAAEAAMGTCADMTAGAGDAQRALEVCAAAEAAIRREPIAYRVFHESDVRSARASNLIRLRRYAEAETLLTRMAEAQQRDGQSRARGATLRLLVNVRTELGRFDDAAKSCAEAERETERELSSHRSPSAEHSEATARLKTVILQCADVLDKAGKPEEAQAARSRAR